jgi:hypothetical protein
MGILFKMINISEIHIRTISTINSIYCYKGFEYYAHVQLKYILSTGLCLNYQNSLMAQTKNEKS